MTDQQPTPASGGGSVVLDRVNKWIGELHVLHKQEPAAGWPGAEPTCI